MFHFLTETKLFQGKVRISRVKRNYFREGKVRSTHTKLFQGKVRLGRLKLNYYFSLLANKTHHTFLQQSKKKNRKILFLLQFYSSIKFLAQIFSFSSLCCAIFHSKHPVFSSFINFYLFLLLFFYSVFVIFYLLGLFTACFLAHSTLIQFTTHVRMVAMIVHCA